MLAGTLLLAVTTDIDFFSPVSGAAMGDVARATYIVLAVLTIVAALWLWALSRRGWALMMVLVGLGLVFNLVLWWYGDPNYIRMAIQAATALYLNSSPVRRLFIRSHDVSRVVVKETGGV